MSYTRKKYLEDAKQLLFDTVIIGGGINGASIAEALSSQGNIVCLIEENDFASGTSQESSNLIWGGIKYLENFEFFLVRSLCKSRNKILQHFPFMVSEISFLTSIEKKFRHNILFLFLGTLLYWCIGFFFTSPPSLYSLKKIKKLFPFINTNKLQGALVYSDAYIVDNDARFVFHFIKKAAKQGAVVLNYVSYIKAKYKAGRWKIKVRDKNKNQNIHIRSKIFINCGGPKLDSINSSMQQQTHHQHIYSKGIHLIVPAISNKKHIFTFFADDGRMFFVIPLAFRSCIGTTDTRVENDTKKILDEDRDFVLENINKRLNLENKLSKEDIIAERCGVRPLVISKQDQKQGEWLFLSRKHIIEVDKVKKHISVFGGKLTDCMNIGEEVLEQCFKLQRDFKILPYKLRQQSLIRNKKKQEELYILLKRELGLLYKDTANMREKEQIEEFSRRLISYYGEDSLEILKNMQKDEKMKKILIPELFLSSSEIHYMARH